MPPRLEPAGKASSTSPCARSSRPRPPTSFRPTSSPRDLHLAPNLANARAITTTTHWIVSVRTDDLGEIETHLVAGIWPKRLACRSRGGAAVERTVRLLWSRALRPPPGECRRA